MLTKAVAFLWAPGRWQAYTRFCPHCVRFLWSIPCLWFLWSPSGKCFFSSTLWAVSLVYTDDMFPWVPTAHQGPLIYSMNAVPLVDTCVCSFALYLQKVPLVSGARVQKELGCIFSELLVQTQKHASLLMQQILFPIQIWKSVKHDNINSSIYDLP